MVQIKLRIHNTCEIALLVLSLSSIMRAQTVINIKDLSSSGVTLTPSTAPDFSSQVMALVGAPTPDASALLPFSVVLKNSTNQAIRGYALRWSYLTREGLSDNNYQVEQNFDTRQKGAEIPPGGGCVLSPVGPLRSAASSYSGSATLLRPDTLKKLANQESITVALDSVAFENGKVIGPNEGFAMNIWNGMYAAQRDFGVATVARAQNSSAADLAAWLQSEATQPEAFPDNSSAGERLSGLAHWYQVYYKMTAQRLLDFNNHSPGVMLAEATRLAQTPVPALKP